MHSIKHITVLTGAGISQESGIKTFRDQNGLWENHSIEEIACPNAFEKDPELVHRFYNLRREQLNQVEPNPAHIALAEAEKYFKVDIVTQNVDDLHERAGSQNVYHMHGELRKLRRISDGDVIPFTAKVEKKDYRLMRPHIVWFGEMVMEMEAISSALNQCDLYLCIGTSNQVYPAAGFIQQIKQRGIPCIELNQEVTALSSWYDETLLGKASQIVPDFISELVSRAGGSAKID